MYLSEIEEFVVSLLGLMFSVSTDRKTEIGTFNNSAILSSRLIEISVTPRSKFEYAATVIPNSSANFVGLNSGANAPIVFFLLLVLSQNKITCVYNKTIILFIE